MNRARFVIAAPLTLRARLAPLALLTMSIALSPVTHVGVGAQGAQGGSAAQTPAPPAPQLTPVLAGRKITPPLRGDAQVQVVWPPVSKRDKDLVVTKLQVKNVSAGPIKGLTIEQPWYNKEGAVSASPRGVINGLLQPNEVQTVTIEVTYKPDMISNNYQFSHANGTVKPMKVAKMEAPAAAEKPKK
jgi:hypothetical protein